MQLVFGHDAAVMRWMAALIPHANGSFGDAVAIGVVDGQALVAGIAYSDFTDGNCQIHMAATTPRWAQRGVIRALLHYPFEQAGMRRVTTLTPHDNARALRFNRGLGFVQEGTIRQLFGPKSHGVVMGLLRRDYDRLFRKD